MGAHQAQAIEVNSFSKPFSVCKQSCKQTVQAIEMLCSYLVQFHFYPFAIIDRRLIRLLFIRLPLQQESGA
jgi:hypothetical protein